MRFGLTKQLNLIFGRSDRYRKLIRRSNKVIMLASNSKYWVGSGWVTQNGPMDNSGCRRVSALETGMQCSYRYGGARPFRHW